MEEEYEIKYDDILQEIGELGRFQLTSYMHICLSIIFSGANFVSYIFTAGVPNYNCVEPICDNGTSFKDKTCNKFVKNHLSSVANDWKLESCSDLNWKLSSIGNVQFAFIILGCFLFGSLSDKFGRKQMYLVSTLLMFVGGTSHLITTSYLSFLFMTAIYGIGIAGVYPVGFVLGVEMVGKSKREFAGVVLSIFFAFGSAMMGLAAYLTQNWKSIQLIISGPVIIFVIYYFYMPESIRWLMAKGKVDDVLLLVDQAAKINKMTISSDTILKIKVLALRKSGLQKKTSKIKPMINDMFKSRILVTRYFIVFYLWIVIPFVYYTMVLNATNMVKQSHLNFILIELIEIPGYFMAWISIYKLGRKYPVLFCIAVCAVCSLALIFIKNEMIWVIMGVQLTIKLFTTTAFQILYVYTAEIYPTMVRSIGVTTSSSLAKLGGFVATFVPILGTYYRSLPGIIICILTGISILLVLKLPETRRKKLPDTVEEAIAM